MLERDDNVLDLSKLSSDEVEKAQIPGNIVNLNIDGCNLRHLPPWLETLTQLQHLSASHNQLATLPVDFAKLKRLRILRIWDNQLTELTDTLRSLTQLQLLNVSRNELTALPETICELSQLQSLHVWDNQLTALPETLGDLSQLRILDVSRNQLTGLPETIGELSKLQSLNVSLNQLTALPERLAELSQLQGLNVSQNQLTALPETLAELTQLRRLHVSQNQLTALPEKLGELSQLRQLDVSQNQLTTLPETLGELSQLQSLHVWHNQLTALPETLGELSQLQSLYASNNQLTKLPERLPELAQLQNLEVSGNQLTEFPGGFAELSQLEALYASDNRLQRIPETMPPSLRRVHLARNRLAQLPDALGDLDKSELETALPLPPNDDWHKQGDSEETNPMDPVIRELGEISNEAIRAYLSERATDSVTLHEAKVMLVGFGGAGKTSLRDHLFGRPFIDKRNSTHALEIEPLLFGKVQARIWDFGGQSEYTATQQFFYSGRSVFLVLWNPREDKPSHDHLHGWLQRIHALAPGSPILLVPTYANAHTANVPLAELRERYPQIDSRLWPIDNADRRGIPELQARLTEVLRQLPHMGTRLPSSWVRAMRQIEADSRNYVLITEFEALLRRAQVAAPQAISLYLESIGAITRIHGQNDWVILKPQWLLQTITRVLTDGDIAAQNGAVHSDRLRAIWSSEPGVVQNFLLEVLDHFDLAYQTETEPIRSIVVERCPEDRPPAVEEQWAKHCAQDGQAVSLRYEFDAAIPPGLPTWFIARSHRYTEPEIHWRRGGLFRDRAGIHHARLTTDLDGRSIQLTVHGPQPHNFFALLRDGFEGTTARFPGLKFERWVPCPGKGCSHRFQLEELEAYLEKPFHPCWKCKTKFSPRALLLGLRASEYEEILRRLDSMPEAQPELIEHLQREFTNLYRAEQSKVDHRCPSVFSLTYDRREFGQRLTQEYPADLSIYCEFPGAWHHACTYRLQAPPKLFQQASELAKKVSVVLKFVAPTLKSKGELLEQLGENRGTAVDLAKEALGLTDGQTDRITREIEALGGEQITPDAATGARLGALRALLEIADPNAKDRWGNLELVHTKQFHSLWVCKEHREELRRRGDSL